MSLEMPDAEAPKVADLSLASSAKMETPTVPLPGAEEPLGTPNSSTKPISGAEEPLGTPNSSTKPKARLNPDRIRPQDTGLKIMFHPPNEEVDYE